MPGLRELQKLIELYLSYIVQKLGNRPYVRYTDKQTDKIIEKANLARRLPLASDLQSYSFLLMNQGSNF